MGNNLECYLCGKAISKKTDGTDDHIPPKILFKKPRPSNLKTLRACWDCNNKYSKDEEYFGDLIVMQGCVKSPYAKKLASERISKIHKHARKKPAYRQYLRNSLTGTESIYTESGIYLGDASGMNLDKTRIDNILKKISKGLYYLEKKKLYSKEPEIYHEIQMYKPKDSTHIKLKPRSNSHEINEIIRNSRKKVIHPDVFEYYYNEPIDNANAAFITMVFYKYFVYFSIFLDEE